MEESNDIKISAVSSFLSQKLNEPVNILRVEKIGGGYHSDGFKVISDKGKVFFLKKLKSKDLGFEIPERRVSSLLIGHGMAKRAGKRPLPIGVILVNDNESSFIPDINEETEIYQIQEFEEGVDYWSKIKDKENKKELDEQDIDELNKIIDFISSVHSVKYLSKDLERLKSIYNDSLRAVLGNSELTLMLLHDFKEDHEFFPRSLQKEYLGLMYDVMHKWKDRFERLCALHGDFWGANLFFRKDGSLWVIDYSRIPWGDPGVDIGWWVSQYWVRYQITNNNYFKDLGEMFLKLYEKKTGDKEIRNSLCISLGLLALVNITPRFYPDLDKKIGKKIIEKMIICLKEGELKWI